MYMSFLLFLWFLDYKEGPNSNSSLEVTETGSVVGLYLDLMSFSGTCCHIAHKICLNWDLFQQRTRSVSTGT